MNCLCCWLGWLSFCCLAQAHGNVRDAFGNLIRKEKDITHLVWLRSICLKSGFYHLLASETQELLDNASKAANSKQDV